MKKYIDFEKSFASHPKAQFWSSKNVGRPEDYSLNSHSKCWFNCDECGHEFIAIIKNVARIGWCPYCAHKKLCDDDNCISCYENSFASHPKSIYWHSSNNHQPRELFKNSHKKYYFNCDKCNHIIHAQLSTVSFKNCWCYYCSHHRMCENDDCNMCFNTSFASISRSKFLNDKNINPRQLFKNSGIKYKFNCDTCNEEFDMKITHVTYSNAWCPHCVNKSEKKMYEELVNHYNVKRQFRVDWCKNANTNKYLPFDFVIENLNIIIELDGPQHFKQIGKWQSPETTQINDLYKMNCANDNGYSIIRILQKDVWHDKYNWLDELIENINKIINDRIIQNIYMCKNDEYNNFCNMNGLIDT